MSISPQVKNLRRKGFAHFSRMKWMIGAGRARGARLQASLGCSYFFAAHPELRETLIQPAVPNVPLELAISDEDAEAMR